MPEFEIYSPDHEDIEIVTEVPEEYKGLLLKNSELLFARCSFGNMLFSHYKGDGFDIWKSHYHIHRNVRLNGGSKDPVLEFTVMYENSFSIDWKDVVHSQLPPKQIEMYYSPTIDTTVHFTGGQQFTTIDFHYHASLLDSYVKDFKLLGDFMEKVHAGKSTRLFEGKQFSSPTIDAAIKEIINYRFHDSLASRYYDSYAHILLIHLLERISDFNPMTRIYSETDKEKAHEAKRLLTSSIDKSYTIKQLCQLLQTNPYKLKTTFKYLFGVSIGKYKKFILMEHARLLLETTNYSIDEISFRLGYSSQQSFSTAFHNYFHKPPSQFRRKG